ncbi:MAG: murein hydrolase activator EnvC family protein [Bacteroidia bacterium]
MNLSKLNKRFCLATSVVLLVFSAFSQKQSEQLQKQQSEIQKKISSTKNLIEQTRSSQKNVINQLQLVGNQIQYREELISTINLQISRISDDVKSTQNEIVLLENNLKELKEEYAQMLRYAYKNRNTDYKLLYIFSSKSLYQAYKRVKYIQQFNEQLHIKAESITKKKKSLDEKVIHLKEQQILQREVKRQNERERLSLVVDKNKQSTIVQQLKSDEKKLLSELKKQEAKKQELAKAIKKAIEREIAEEAKKAEKENASKGTSTTTTATAGFTITPEIKLASENFELNKGKLPWPVERGEITGKFGVHQHEIVKTATVENNGIDISTTKDAEVRAVFNGKVTSIIIIPGAGKVVMVSHGAYRTVYSNLKEVFVQKGDVITTKQKIGVLLPEGSISQAHFEIWKINSSGQAQKQNPEYWIYRK